ncbi:hypothetical protein [Estrella lausannensis]|nr:hypothetical protein [Estrella lausannensis]
MNTTQFEFNIRRSKCKPPLTLFAALVSSIHPSHHHEHSAQ